MFYFLIVFCKIVWLKYCTGGDMKVSKEKIGLAIAGGIVGLSAVILTIFGNPKNMGFCIACFVRDMA